MLYINNSVSSCFKLKLIGWDRKCLIKYSLTIYFLAVIYVNDFFYIKGTSKCTTYIVLYKVCWTITGGVSRTSSRWATVLFVCVLRSVLPGRRKGQAWITASHRRARNGARPTVAASMARLLSCCLPSSDDGRQPLASGTLQEQMRHAAKELSHGKRRSAHAPGIVMLAHACPQHVRDVV